MFPECWEAGGRLEGVTDSRSRWRPAHGRGRGRIRRGGRATGRSRGHPFRASADAQRRACAARCGGRAGVLEPLHQLAVPSADDRRSRRSGGPVGSLTSLVVFRRCRRTQAYRSPSASPRPAGAISCPRPSGRHRSARDAACYRSLGPRRGARRCGPANAAPPNAAPQRSTSGQCNAGCTISRAAEPRPAAVVHTRAPSVEVRRLAARGHGVRDLGTPLA